MGIYQLHLFGLEIAIWNAVLLLGIAVAYPVFRRCISTTTQFSTPTPRYLLMVYLCALAAQLFAYLFDATGSLVPPPGTSLGTWYLSPLGGPKTLYGVIVLMPLIVGVGTVGLRLPLMKCLDLCTPAMLLVLAIARVGCFLQGCCYGRPSTLFGISFPIGSPVYFHQVETGIITAGSMPLPVVPTQALEAVFLAILAVLTIRGRGSVRRFGLFLPSAAAYSVFRFAVEFVRADPERGVHGPLATSQWIALAVLVVVGIALQWRLATRADSFS